MASAPADGADASDGGHVSPGASKPLGFVFSRLLVDANRDGVVEWLRTSYLGADRGIFEPYGPNLGDTSTYDSYGNHEVIPPYVNGSRRYPLGRILVRRRRWDQHQCADQRFLQRAGVARGTARRRRIVARRRSRRRDVQLRSSADATRMEAARRLPEGRTLAAGESGAAGPRRSADVPRAVHRRPERGLERRRFQEGHRTPARHGERSRGKWAGAHAALPRRLVDVPRRGGEVHCGSNIDGPTKWWEAR